MNRWNNHWQTEYTPLPAWGAYRLGCLAALCCASRKEP